jgi:hypothetical protein
MSRTLPAVAGGTLLQGQAATLTRIVHAEFVLAAASGVLAVAGASVALRGLVWTPTPLATAPWTAVAPDFGAWTPVDDNPQTWMGP